VNQKVALQPQAALGSGVSAGLFADAAGSIGLTFTLPQANAATNAGEVTADSRGRAQVAAQEGQEHSEMEDEEPESDESD
jgi:hypothetical protein